MRKPATGQQDASKSRVVALFGDGTKAGIAGNGRNKHAYTGIEILDAIADSANGAGGQMLFEIPAVLLSANGMRAAAISTNGGEDLVFILFDPESGEINMLDSAEVPGTVNDFTRSYAGVLSLIAGDAVLVAPLLQ